VTPDVAEQASAVLKNLKALETAEILPLSGAAGGLVSIGMSFTDEEVVKATGRWSSTPAPPICVDMIRRPASSSTWRHPVATPRRGSPPGRCPASPPRPV
jgi:hypothetical protein